MTKLIYLLPLLLVGCFGPLRPGTARVSFPNGATAQIKQSQNPQEPSTQVYERVTESVSNSPNVIRSTERVETRIGAAQKDTAREIGAKLSALRPVVWVGVLLFVLGAASAVYPPLKVLTGGSLTTSIVIAGVGLALIVLPSLIVGNEILILIGGVSVAVVYWFAHRHGSLKGALEALKPK